MGYRKRNGVATTAIAAVIGHAVQASPPSTNPSARQGPPTVRVEAIEEERARNAAKVHASAALGEELTLGIGYTAGVDSPAAYGSWHVRQAVDDLGTDLRPPAPPAEPKAPASTQALIELLESATDFVESNERFTSLQPEFLKMDRDRGVADFPVTLRLAPAPRAATRIAHLAGDVTVYTGGAVRTATFDRPTRLFGHPLEDAALHAAGVSVDLLPANAEANPNQISIETGGPHVRLRCRGNLRAFVDPKVKVIGADGKSAAAGFSDVVDGEKSDQIVSLGLSKPLDDTMKIQLTVIAGQRAVVVPFDLRDLKLP